MIQRKLETPKRGPDETDLYDRLRQQTERIKKIETTPEAHNRFYILNRKRALEKLKRS